MCIKVVRFVQKTQSIENKTFVVIAHYTPYMPDAAEVHQWDGEAFQEMVNRIFFEHSLLRTETRQWLFELEWYVFGEKEELTRSAPAFLKSFLDRYSFNGFDNFVSSIRLLYEVDEEVEATGKPTSVVEFYNRWTAITMNSFLLLNMKRAFYGDYGKDDLEVDVYEWRSSNLMNNWGILPERITGYIDRSLLLKFESNICRFQRKRRSDVRRRAMAYVFRKLISEWTNEYRQYDRLIRMQVEVGIFYDDLILMTPDLLVIECATIHFARVQDIEVELYGVTRYLLATRFLD